MRDLTRCHCALASTALLGALALTGAPAALANEGRHEALASSPLVRDDLDVVDFPGLLTTYGDLVFLSVRDNAQTGNVGAFIGRQRAFGLWVHRRPRFQDLADLDELFDSFTLPTPHHLADLMFGMSNGFGLRLSFSAGLQSDEAEDLDSSDLLSTGGASLSSELQLGYSLDRDRYHGDFAAGLTLNWFEVVSRGDSTFTTGWAPSFMIRHRSEIDPLRPVAWAIDVMLTRRAYTAVAEGDPEATGTFGRWIANLTGGPKLRLPGGLTVWVGAQLRLEQLAGTVDDGLEGIEPQPQPTVTALGPGVILSAELLLFDLLAIRAGAAYDFFWADSSVPATPSSTSRGTQELAQRFQWSTGIGFELQGFRLDGTLSHELLFGGPEFLGGRQPGLLGTVSASYAW